MLQTGAKVKKNRCGIIIPYNYISFGIFNPIKSIAVDNVSSANFAMYNRPALISDGTSSRKIGQL